jgi:hypothetical protein
VFGRVVSDVWKVRDAFIVRVKMLKYDLPERYEVSAIRLNVKNLTLNDTALLPKRLPFSTLNKFIIYINLIPERVNSKFPYEWLSAS